MMRPRASLILGLLILALLLFPDFTLAQNVGSIQGRVKDSDTGEPIAFTDVILVGTGKGTITKKDGTFILVQVPEGYYQVRLNRMGYLSKVLDQVKVEAGYSKKLNVSMDPIAVREVETIEVSGERALVDVQIAKTSHYVTAKEIEAMAVTVIDDVVGKQAGVIVEDDALYVRGGRAEDTVYRVDGVIIRDLITGRSSAGTISARTVQSVEIITGGFDAEFGQALAGVIDIKTKEGSLDYHGYGEYQTNVPFLAGWRSDGTFSREKLDFNLDNFEFQIEGAEPLSNFGLKRLGMDVPGKLTFFLSLSGAFDDTYLPVQAADDPRGATPDQASSTLNSNYRDKFLGFEFGYDSDFWTPRAQNRWQGLYKMSWQANGRNKLNLSFSKKLEIDHGFFRRNLVNAVDPSSTSSNYNYEWSFRKDHDYTYTDDTNTITFDWRKIWNRRFTTTLRLSRAFNAFFQNVNGKPWFEYQEGYDQDLTEEEDNVFFEDTGDNEVWHNRYTEAWTAYMDGVHKKGDHHTIKGGFELSYEDVQFLTISEPWVFDEDGLGRFHDLWHVNPTTGAMFIQDKFIYEGFVGNIGLRYDYWFPGKAAEDAIADTSRDAFNPTLLSEFENDTQTLLGRQFKATLLPRFQVSHPVTDRSHLFFNYGHFSQRPNYFFVYSKIASVSSEDFPLIGNLNLDPKREVKYELGARHQVRNDMALDFSVFYNDIYDYPKSVRFERRGRSDFFVYINEDFARARGFELELRKKRTKYLWARAAYTYSVVSGKASDPNQSNLLQEEVGAFTQIGEDEEFLFWNRPHKLTLDLTMGVGPKTDPPTVFGYTLPRDWSLNLYYWVQSGRAYTPTNDADEEVAKENSGNAPFETTFDMRFSKGIQVWGSKLKYLLEVRNLFNHIYPRRIDAITGRGFEIGEGTLSGEQPPSRFVQFGDPSFWSRPRSVRVGLSTEF